jgi:RNA-directed DNA polymerase
VETGIQPSLALVRRVSPAASPSGCLSRGAFGDEMGRGYFANHAGPTNSHAITFFMHYDTWHWKRALGRRSQKGHVNWTRMAPIAARWLPPARVQHPYPQQRFIAKHPRWEPSALAAHARICPGGAG